jgi:hypothetical protein
MLTAFAYAQQDKCPEVTNVIVIKQEQIDKEIGKRTVDSSNTKTHYAQKLNVKNIEEFNALVKLMQTFGHKAGGDFDKWKNKEGNNPEHYMFYRVADGKVDLYYEKLDEDEQFPQYLPKGYTIFDKNIYNDLFNNKHFNDAAFSQNHWKAGGNAKARLKDMQNLAVSFANILGINIEPAKITFRTDNKVQKIEGIPDMRISIITETARNDGVAGVAKGNDDVTSIEIDADELGKASISSAISIIAEEVYHKYQMAVVQGTAKEESGLKKAQWVESFKDNNKNDYGTIANDLQKEINKLPQNDKRREPLEQQRDAAIHSYYNLTLEKDAKEFAGKMAAMEYYVRNIGNFK